MSRRIWLTGSAVGVAALSAFVACQTPTSMTVTVSTDVDCGNLVQERLAHIVVGTPKSVVGDLEAASTKSCSETGPIGQVVLLPKDDEEAEVAFKVILGVDVPTESCGAGEGTEEEIWAGCIVARRRLRFIEGEALEIDVPLHEECIGVPCSEASFETCVAGGRCVPADVDPDDCLGGSCGEDDLSASAASGAVASSSSTSSGDGGASPTSVSGASTTQGGGGGGGGGGGPECVDADRDCESLDDCMVPACVEGSCSTLPADALEPCEGGVCDGQGLCVECIDEQQCAQEPCSTPSCEGGICVYDPRDDSTVCDQTCDDGTATTSYCDGEGFCGPPTADVACYPYLCEGDVCGATCIDEEDCIDGADCDVDACVLECVDVADCPPPDGACQVAACGFGSCEAVAGNDGQQCSPAQCSEDGGSVEAPGVCQSGACMISATSCGNYACVGGSCMEDCLDDEDCFGGATCNLGSCGFGGTTSSASSVSASSVSASSVSASSVSASSVSATSGPTSSVSVASSASTAETTVAASSVSIASSGQATTGPGTTVGNASNVSAAEGDFVGSDGGAPPW